MSDTSNDRRSFLQRLGAYTLAGVMPGVRHGSASPAEPWLTDLHGRHKQFFDVGRLAEGKPLARIANFMRAYVAAYELRPGDVNALFGAHADGLGFVSTDALWSRLQLGTLYEAYDPATKMPVTRNPFVDEAHGALAFGIAADATVSALMRQGVRFLACNNSIDSLAKRLAGKGFGTEAALRKEITNGLLPGVYVVPAMLIAGNRAQESGFTYALLS